MDEQRKEGTIKFMWWSYDLDSYTEKKTPAITIKTIKKWKQKEWLQ